MKSLVSIIALTLELAVIGPALAGDVSTSTNPSRLRNKLGFWDAEIRKSTTTWQSQLTSPARGMYFGTCPNVGHDEAHACPTENKTNSICLKFLVKYRERQGNRMRTRVIDGWRLFHCATLTSPELRVQVVDNNIVVTLPDYSYAVTYSTPMGLPVCS